MKKMIFKISIILLMLQLVMFVSDINIVSADLMMNIEEASEIFSAMGSNKITSMGISAATMTDAIVFVASLLQFIGIAVACIRLLLTSLRLLKQDSIKKADAKQDLTISLIILIIAIAGPTLVIELVRMF